MRREWLYYLINDLGQCYTVVNGVVQVVSAKVPLKLTADGWQEISLGWERTLARLGMLRNFSIPLNFYGDAATILRYLYHSRNIEEKVYLLIQKFDLDIDNDYYYPVHKFFYKGELDLSTFKDENLGVSINIVEGGILQKLKAKESLAIEIPLNVPEAVQVKNDGMHLQERQNYLLTEGSAHLEHFLGASTTTAEGDAAGFATFSVFCDEVPNGYDYVNGTDFLFSVSQDIAGIRIFGKITVRVAAPVWQAYLYTSTGRAILLAGTSTGVVGETYSFDFDVTFDAFEGEKFYLLGFSAEFFFNCSYSETTFSIEYQSRYPATFTRGHKLSTLAKRITRHVTGSESDIDTSFLEQFDNLVITCGDSIRDLPNPVLKTTPGQFLEFCRVVLGADHGIKNGKITVQPFSFFLNTNNPVHLGKAKDLKVYPATEVIANSFKVGYQAQTYDDVNGRYEFNNTHLYGTPITKIVKEHAVVSPYRADPYGIELTRINLTDKVTTDSSSDNDTFVLNSVPFSFSGININASTNDGVNSFLFQNGKQYSEWFRIGGQLTISNGTSNNGAFTISGVIPIPLSNNVIVIVQEAVVPGLITGATVDTNGRQLKRVVYDSISGVPDPVNIYNIEQLTPKRIAITHSKWFNSILYGFAGQNLTFLTTEKNSLLWTATNNPPNSIKENADIGIGGDLLFKPVWFEIDVEVPVNLAEILDVDPYRCFTFEWDGLIWKGFLFKGGIAPDNNKEQVFKLLSAPENDLTKLIS